jgi:alpha-1,6-mannosyltransferase
MELPWTTFKFFSLLLVRGALGLIYVVFSGLLRKSFSVYWTGTLSTSLSAFWTLILVAQFHLNFYATRMLPNTFALCLVLLAYHFWFSGQYYHLVCAFVFSTVVFRGELIVLFGPIGLELATRLPFWKLFATGAISGVASLAITVLVDSFMWQRWLWPEGEVLYFNTFLNKSHEWGTLPFYWYFLVAIPKTLMGSLFVILLCYDWIKIWRLVLPTVAFVALYSILPHKELRFIIYAFPVFNVCSTISLLGLWNRAKRSSFFRLVFLASIAILLASIFASIGIGYISSMNYPGAMAINALHKSVDKSQATTTDKISVHLDVAACQTGISRFLESHPRVSYSKAENINNFERFTHRITEKLSNYHYDPERDGKDLIDGSKWQITDTIKSFHGLRRIPSFPFIEILTEPSMYVYRKVKPHK